jgi:hypothetical protein
MATAIVGAGEFGRGQVWPAGRYVLQLSGSGNLELWNSYSGQLLWESGTASGARLAMQEDGNLVIYSESGKPLWASGTHDNPGAVLAVQDDGNVVIYSAEQKPLWATHTAAAERGNSFG